MTVFDVQDLSYSTPTGRVLQQGLTFRIRSGEMLLIRGPNGSGKSTLLKTLLGVIHPTEGSIDCAIGQRQWHYIPQLENTEFHLPFTLQDVLSVTYGRIDPKRVTRYGLISASQLSGAWNTASGGERKRTLLTRALLSEPQILVLDEPMNHLDKASRKAMIRSMAEFLDGHHEKSPRAAVMVCHQGLSEEELPLFRVQTLSLQTHSNWEEVTC